MNVPCIFTIPSASRTLKITPGRHIRRSRTALGRLLGRSWAPMTHPGTLKRTPSTQQAPPRRPRSRQDAAGPTKTGPRRRGTVPQQALKHWSRWRAAMAQPSNPTPCLWRAESLQTRVHFSFHLISFDFIRFHLIKSARKVSLMGRALVAPSFPASVRFHRFLFFGVPF